LYVVLCRHPWPGAVSGPAPPAVRCASLPHLVRLCGTSLQRYMTGSRKAPFFDFMSILARTQHVLP
jgi:hypothetical protein